jgi:hypothetical protein
MFLIAQKGYIYQSSVYSFSPFNFFTLKSTFITLLFVITAFVINAQSRLFEFQFTGAVYADIAPSKGGAKIDSKSDHPVFDSKRRINGFETTIQLFDGQLMFMAIASPSNIVTIKQFSAFMQKKMTGFDRIDNLTMKLNDPSNTIASAGFMSEDKLRVVNLYISADSTMRMIIADKPGSNRPDLIYVKDRKSKKIGFKDVANPLPWRIAPKYTAVDLFSEGFAAVNLGGKETAYGNSGGKWGFVDVNGNEIIPIKYESVTDFSEGLALVLNGGNYGYVNKKGALITPMQYSSAKSFDGGMAWVTLGTESYYIDHNGERIR